MQPSCSWNSFWGLKEEGVSGHLTAGGVKRMMPSVWAVDYWGRRRGGWGNWADRLSDTRGYGQGKGNDGFTLVSLWPFSSVDLTRTINNPPVCVGKTYTLTHIEWGPAQTRISAHTHWTRLLDWLVIAVFPTSHRKENKHEKTRLLLFPPASNTDKERITWAVTRRKQLKPLYVIGSFPFKAD